MTEKGPSLVTVSTLGGRNRRTSAGLCEEIHGVRMCGNQYKRIRNPETIKRTLPIWRSGVATVTPHLIHKDVPLELTLGRK